MSCEEKARLVRMYNVATAGFSETVKEEYLRLTQISSEARLRSEQA